jgi:hypothetical protein
VPHRRGARINQAGGSAVADSRVRRLGMAVATAGAHGASWSAQSHFAAAASAGAGTAYKIAAILQEGPRCK